MNEYTYQNQKQEPMDEDRTMRADELYRRLEKEFDPNQPLTVGDLTTVGRKFAQKVLTYAERPQRLIQSEVTDCGATYIWSISDKLYQPAFGFIARDQTPLYFDERGRLYGLTHTFAAKGFLKGEMEFLGNEIRLLAGKYWPKNDVFEPTPALDATHVMVEVSWGGPQSTLRGVPRLQDLDGNWMNDASPTPATCAINVRDRKLNDLVIARFCKCTSKNGGQGYDFYILPLDQPVVDVRKALIRPQKEHFLRQANEAQTLQQKLQMIGHLQDVAAEVTEAAEDCTRQVERTNARCLSNEVCNEPCTSAPHFQISISKMNGVDPLNLGSYDLDKSLEELNVVNSAVLTMQIMDELECTMAKIQATVMAWQIFAPRYNLLRAQIEGYCGYLEVRPDHAYVQLPSQDSSMEKLERNFYYSNVQFAECVKLLETYTAKEAASYHEIEKLLEEMWPEK